MILLYDATETYNPQWARTAPTGTEVAVASDIWSYDDISARAAGVVAFVRDKEDPELLERLQELRALYPVKFLVVVRATPEDPSLPFTVDETLYATMAATTLWAAIRDVERNGLLHRLADVIRSNEQMPPMLRLSLVHVLLRPIPISSIKELAAEIGCERRTLPRAWELYFGTKDDRLIEFLDWMILIYAAGRKTPKRSWIMVAQDLAVAQETLARSVRQLVGLSLSELSVQGQAFVVSKFRPIFERLFGRWPDDLDSTGARPPRLSPRVLIVDDHDAIRQFLNHSLSKAGFDISTASAADEALLRIARSAEPPKVVLTDIKMPGMDGLELARRIAQEWPDVQIILMSAFISLDGVKLDWVREDIAQSIRFLSKPFSAGRIVALLRQTCDVS